MADEDPTEQTPLLRPRPEVTIEASRPSKARTIYVSVFSILILLAAFVYTFDNTLPTALSDAEAEAIDGFSGIHCYNEYLSRFTFPHSGNQRGNYVMKKWLETMVQDFATKAENNGIRVDVDIGDNTTTVLQKETYGPNDYWYMESRNIMLRLWGSDSSLKGALLINAHYDSASPSNGVTDNGIGTSVALELMRYLVQHPPRQTIIFLFNDMEENGLVGAEVFVRHPWFHTVKAFVNVEGAGAGGRVLMFRASHLGAIRQLATSDAHYLHASPLGNDLLQSKLVRSDTDFTTFMKHGVPGLDIAFYQRRSHYHTQRDDLAHTTVDSVQHMGQMVLGVVKRIAFEGFDDDYEPEPSIYFDVLGRFIIVYSFNAVKIVQILALVLVPLGNLAWVWTRSDQRREDLKMGAIDLGRGLTGVMAALLFMVPGMAFASWFMACLNPSLTYGNAYLAVFYLAVTAVVMLFLSQHVYQIVVRKLGWRELDMTASLDGLTAFWWVLVVFATYLCTKKVAALYFAIYFFAFNALASVIERAWPERHQNHRYARLLTVFAIQSIFVSILMVEMCLLVVGALRYTTADGTSELLVYGMISLPLLFITLQLLPWLHRASNEFRRPIIFTSFILIVMFIICLAQSPFNSGDSPNRILFHQSFNSSDPSSLSTVILTSGPVGFQAMLSRILKRQEEKSLSCSPVDSLVRCTYQTQEVPLYSQETDVQVSVKKNCASNECSTSITALSEHSVLCQLAFDANYTLEATANHHPVTDEPALMSGIMIFSKTLGAPMTWSLSYTDQEAPKTASLHCLYDDWEAGELPAYSTLRNRLPGSALLTFKGGVGLARVRHLTFDI